MQKQSVAVIGSGSWATAIVKILLRNNVTVNWWVREPEIIAHLRDFHHNPLYLSSVEIHADDVFVSGSIMEVIEKSDIILLCVPAAFLHRSLKKVPTHLFKGKIIVSAIKGLVPEYKLVIADYVNQHLMIDLQQFVVVSGPSHAEEVARERLTCLTVASLNPEHIQVIRKLFACRFIKTDASDDIFGIEYAAVLKNIVAVASGICHGLGYGDNFQAVLISQALSEIRQFLHVVHPRERDLFAPVYLGDLLVTCYSQFSRNRTFGTFLGKGYSVTFAQVEMQMVAEGYYASKAIASVKERYHITMPVADAVYNIIYNNQVPASAIRNMTDAFVCS
jgi:glycerol-3-phosphate dehydrogenase (NAD(P)+)